MGTPKEYINTVKPEILEVIKFGSSIKKRAIKYYNI